MTMAISPLLAGLTDGRIGRRESGTEVPLHNRRVRPSTKIAALLGLLAILATGGNYRK